MDDKNTECHLTPGTLGSLAPQVTFFSLVQAPFTCYGVGTGLAEGAPAEVPFKNACVGAIDVMVAVEIPITGVNTLAGIGKHSPSKICLE